MANQKILDSKQEIINEIAENIKTASSVVWFEYQGLTSEEANELRKALKASNSKYKVYKNTFTKRALDSLKIDLGEELEGPKAIAFSEDAIMPIKTLSEFAKKHPALEIKLGIIDGEITDKNSLSELAKIPSREGLLTMVAGGLMGIARDFAICLDLHSQNLEKENN